MILLIKNIEESKKYIEDLKFNMLLYRLEQDRLNLNRLDRIEEDRINLRRSNPLDLNPISDLRNKTTDIIYAESFCDKCDDDAIRQYRRGMIDHWPNKLDRGSFDDMILEIKEQALRDLLYEYTEGISIHPMGWMCPFGQESYFDSNTNEFDKLFGREFVIGD